MMGTPFSPGAKHKNLYSFWGENLADALRNESNKSDVLINLASSEYFKAVPVKVLDRRVITCEFREKKNGKYIPIMTFAKQARGLMARFIIQNRIDKPEDVKSFDTNDYSFNKSLSSENLWTFTREKSYPVKLAQAAGKK